MSKLELILTSSGRPHAFRRKYGGGRARVLLLALTTLLITFVLLTQPQVRAAVEPVFGAIPGF